jgi:transposase
MGRRSTIYRNRLESYVMDLFVNQRKTIKEIAQLIQKKKKISISRESVRRFIVTEQNEG